MAIYQQSVGKWGKTDDKEDGRDQVVPGLVYTEVLSETKDTCLNNQLG
jgi:hypothetical protein